MRTIESELHKVLLEFDPDSQDYEDQALILVEAAAILNEGKTRRAASTKEASHLDAILQASEKFARMESRGGDKDELDIFLTRAAMVDKEADYRYAGREDFYGDMNVLADDDLDALFRNDADDNDEYEVSDIYDEDLNRFELYRTPGSPRHRSDSLAR